MSDQQNNNDQFDEFDEDENSKAKSSEFAQMLEASFKAGSKKKLAVGDKIKAEVLVIGKEEIFVSTGTMNDGQVSRRDLLDENGQLTCKAGDTLDLYVTQVKGSEVLLSPKPTAKNLADDLEDAFDMMLPVEGRVSEVCKGGVRVVIRGKTAFCPISQLDFKRTETGEEYVGQKLEFIITQFSEGGRNIVVSRRKYLEEQRGVSEAAFQEEKKPGDIVTGAVTRIEPFGAFVEIAPGIEGMAHISELGWSRVQHPSELVTIGKIVTAKILKMEGVDGRLKISLSLKQAQSEPWANLPDQVRVGQVVEGRVTRCMKFGAFVQVAPGIEGLVPMSEMSYTKRVMRSDELMKEGEKVTVMVKEIRPDERRILLSLKDAGSDPWALVPQNFPVGRIVQGKVEKRESYGLFIRLDEGIVGLLPRSKAMEDPSFPFEKLKPGDETSVMIGEVRQEERRISLSVPSDAGRDDWKAFTPQSQASLGTLGGAWGDKLKAALENKGKKKG